MNGISCNRSFKVSGPGQIHTDPHRPNKQSRRTHHASQQADWTGGFSVTIKQVFSCGKKKYGTSRPTNPEYEPDGIHPGRGSGLTRL